MRGFLSALIGSIALVSAPLFAQEQESPRGKIGLTLPGIGAILHLTDHVAFVPGVGFTHNWSSLSSAPTTTAANNLSVSAALRFYVRDWKGLRFYLSPKYSFSRSTSERNAGGTGYGTDSSTAGDYHAAYGSWGIQYAISDRVSIFGDMGAFYSRSTYSTSSSAMLGGDTYSQNVGTSGSWGLIFYLK
jgi:hypothetical protein